VRILPRAIHVEKPKTDAAEAVRGRSGRSMEFTAQLVGAVGGQRARMRAFAERHILIVAIDRGGRRIDYRQRSILGAQRAVEYVDRAAEVRLMRTPPILVARLN
jgi:hypothetical protein